VKVILRSRIFLANSQRVTTDAGIVLENGLILDVGKYEEVKAGTVDAHFVEYDGILCPALINAHTHLELSPFKSARLDSSAGTGGKAPSTDFVGWVLHLVAERFSRQYDDLSLECSRAKSEAERLGTSYFVNVGNDFGINGKLGKNQLFQFEQIGINDAVAESIFQKALSHVSGGNGTAISLAIHAPYSTSPSLMKKIKTYNNDRGSITSLHLAETEDEVEFIMSGKGRMVDLLNARLGAGNWSFKGTGLSPVEYVESLGLLDEKTLCVHCVFAGEKDLKILKKRRCGVAICVRSNRDLTGSIPDISKFVKNGVKILLGTDSKASSPDLDMFAEMSAFYEESHRFLDPSDVLRMATTDASDFLGVSDRYGEIAPGKISPVVHVPFAGKAEDAFEFLVTDAKGKTEAIDY
jgi:cytosine/adenosine deaminase-related metal-dependent hydrolase